MDFISSLLLCLFVMLNLYVSHIQPVPSHTGESEIPNFARYRRHVVTSGLETRLFQHSFTFALFYALIHAGRCCRDGEPGIDSPKLLLKTIFDVIAACYKIIM